MQTTGVGLMGAVALSHGLRHDLYPGHLCQLIFKRHRMGHEFKPFIQTAIMLDIDILSIPVGYVQQFLSFGLILAALVDLKLHAEKAGAIAVEVGCRAVAVLVDDPTVQHIMAGLTVRLIIVPEIESVVFVKQTAAAGAVNIVSFITAAAEDQIAAALIVVVPNAPSAVFAHRSLRFETGGTKELAIELRQLCSGKFMPTMGTYFLGFHSQLPP